jgi:hypothetical protein
LSLVYPVNKVKGYHLEMTSGEVGVSVEGSISILSIGDSSRTSCSLFAMAAGVVVFFVSHKTDTLAVK